MKKEEADSLRFVVLGAARSGIAAAKLLKSHGAEVVIADSKPVDMAQDIRREMHELGIASAWGDTYARAAIAGRDVMVKSPGIPPSNPLVAAAKHSGMRIISEIELASAFVPDGARVIAITGTNGKTTTTAWLTHVLTECGYAAVQAGNIGDAWCSQVDHACSAAENNCIFVVEVSSFQLEDLEDFSPDVAILTNVTPDHMDRYDDRLELYVQAKANILRNMGPDNVFIWNEGNASSQPVADMSKASKWGFNVTAEAGVVNGDNAGPKAWVRDGWLMVRNADHGGVVKVVEADELPLPGSHNVENALCVVLAAMAVGAAPEAIAAGLKSFAGVEHRIELCGTRPDGVRFYNDSKATNLDAMEKAVLAFEQPIVLIAGGRDAHSDYGSIAHHIKERVCHLIMIGEATDLIEASWGQLVPPQRATSMAEAVAMADAAATAGSVVLFSPACKSFDMYENFEERGRDFKAEVARRLSES